MKKIIFYKQLDRMDCGPTCLRIISKYYDKNISLQRLRELCEINKVGVSLLGIASAAEKIGFNTIAVKTSIEKLRKAPLPCILHWNRDHFIVLYKIKRHKFYIVDPRIGKIYYEENKFKNFWIADNRNNVGVALFLTVSPNFENNNFEEIQSIKWTTLFKYLKQYKVLIAQLIVSLLIGSILQLIIPFLTQSIVDVGINTRNLSFVYLILIAQAILIVGRISIDIIRSWILLHISTRINVSILTDFLIKLMKLPISYFDTKMTGDIMQRMNDQQRIENFLTGSALNSFFSLFTLLIFSIVLFYYEHSIFLIFSIGSALYLSWIILFLGKRRSINFKIFEVASKNQNKIVQLVNGMQEIKLNNSEQIKRWEWQSLQAKLFKLNVKNLSLNQYQHGGGNFINESKNLLITMLSAKAVIEGHLTMGAMLAVQYIVGQLNGPIDQILNFILEFQDAKISLERLNEVHLLANEEFTEKSWGNQLPDDKSIKIENLTFRYPGSGSQLILKNINIDIPSKKITAIVGMSGSGKTTILKLLLRFYNAETGKIKIGNKLLNDFSFKFWRNHCGVVMQDGFIFSDTIKHNIAVGDENPDTEKINYAVSVANLDDFINSLYLGLNTIIGAEGSGISQGQRQRILIARAVYKNPDFLFFDEATNALDANNEKVIMDNLNFFFKGRTVIVVAHRLSTVKNADKIIVLNNGTIIEEGTHEELVSIQGHYFGLVKNQLELGN